MFARIYVNYSNHTKDGYHANVNNDNSNSNDFNNLSTTTAIILSTGGSESMCLQEKSNSSWAGHSVNSNDSAFVAGTSMQ